MEKTGIGYHDGVSSPCHPQTLSVLILYVDEGNLLFCVSAWLYVFLSGVCSEALVDMTLDEITPSNVSVHKKMYSILINK